MLELVYFKIDKNYYGILYNQGKFEKDLKFTSKEKLNSYIDKLLNKGYSLRIKER
jgi:hypothetical protein